MADISADEAFSLISSEYRVQPQPDNRPQFYKKLSVWIILLTVSLERLAFYSLAANLILFLTSDDIRWTSLHSITASLIFYGTSYISAIIFSWISDAKLGRAKTILIGFALYSIGYIFITLFSKAHIYETLCGGSPMHIDESSAYFKEKCSGQITAALIFTAIGIGAVQANMAIFGAEQIGEEQAISRYFDKYYASVNIGCLIALGIIAYIQQNETYFIGYVISTGILGVTIIIFIGGYRYYRRIKPYDSVITKFVPVLINAFQTWRKYKRHTREIVDEHSSSKGGTLSSDYNENSDLTHSINEKSISFFDYAKVSYNGGFLERTVDEIKSLRRIVLLFLLLIPYWLMYLQSDTTFILQGVHMKVPQFQSNTRHMPVVWLSLSDQVIIILIILILNTCVYKRLHINNRLFSHKVRIIIGMISATLSMCLTGIVEIFRQKNCDLIILQDIGNTTYSAANMWVFYQFPQYISMGLSEVFTSVASLEFAYLAAPQSAQSLVMSLRFCSVGISSFLGSAYMNIYEKIYENFTMTNLECKDAEKSELFYIYFFVLAGIQLIFILIFLGCDRKFQLGKIPQHQYSTHVFLHRNYGTSTA